MNLMVIFIMLVKERDRYFMLYKVSSLTWKIVVDACISLWYNVINRIVYDGQIIYCIDTQ